MSDNLDESQAPGEAGTTASSTRLQRRRVLLSALGKGGVVLGAAVPLASHAIPTLLTTNPMGGGTNNRLCTLSGVGSVVHSGIPLSAQTQCQGYSPAHYRDAASWTGFDKATATVADVLVGGGSSGSSPTAQSVLEAAPGDDLHYWIAAALNAARGLNTFPYSLAEVRQQYAAGSTSALNFYKDYLSGVN